MSISSSNADHLVAELDVLGLHRVDRPAEGAEDDGALLLQACLERIEALLVADPMHDYPNRPVT